MTQLDALKRLAELQGAATPGPWRSHKGQGPDKFSPKGYRWVGFGPGKEPEFGTDQLSPENADYIAAMRDLDAVRVLAIVEAAEAVLTELDIIRAHPGSVMRVHPLTHAALRSALDEISDE